jgi:hypothetical protein
VHVKGRRRRLNGTEHSSMQTHMQLSTARVEDAVEPVTVPTFHTPASSYTTPLYFVACERSHLFENIDGEEILAKDCHC